MTRHNDRHRLRDLRDDRRRAADPSRPTRKGLVAKVIGLLAVVAVAGLFVGRPGCRGDVQQANTLPPKKPLAKLKAAELQQQTAEYGIAGGVAAGMKEAHVAKQAEVFDEFAEPTVTHTDAGFVVSKMRTANPRALKDEKAREEATRELYDKARAVLVEQGKVPPGDWKMTHDKAKEREVPPDESEMKAWVALGQDTSRRYLEIDEVTLTHDTLRQERAKVHTAQAGFWFGTAFLGLLAVYGFLRLDMWTKGYLTLILGVVVGGVVVAAVVGLGMAVLK